MHFSFWLIISFDLINSDRFYVTQTINYKYNWRCSQRKNNNWLKFANQLSFWYTTNRRLSFLMTTTKRKKYNIMTSWKKGSNANYTALTGPSKKAKSISMETIISGLTNTLTVKLKANTSWMYATSETSKFSMKSTKNFGNSQSSQHRKGFSIPTSQLVRTVVRLQGTRSGEKSTW